MTAERLSAESAAPPPVDASMHDMLRIMDVASALRRQRETADAQLDIETQKQHLRERLLATAAAAGEPVTAAEVDTAIAEYYRRQHRYEDPPAGWARFWASAWVLRKGLLAFAFVVALVIFGLILLARSVSGPSPSQPTSPPPHRAEPSAPAAVPTTTPKDAPETFAEAWQGFQRAGATALALAADEDAKQRVRRVLGLGEATQPNLDLEQLGKVRRELTDLVARLEEQYVVQIVSRPGEQSGIDRFEAGRLSGHYLIVEAVAPNGRALPRDIRNAENQRRETVTKWGELVPDAVWNRIVADKKADGVVDEIVFARKLRGSYDESTVIEDGQGKLLRRGRQITRW